MTRARPGERKGDFLAGKYLLEDCLGIGGMGEVYRATNVSLGRKVAIKLLSPKYVHIEEDVLRFLREARAAAAVRHVNVVDVLDVARDDDGTPFIVQELLSGLDLEQHLKARGGRLSWNEALEIMIPVADAVAAAHAHDVVHRDLKPANIFLAKDRSKLTPKVLDFGACLFPTIAERSAKEVRMLIGTPHYMAPEQIVSKAEVDQRSDVWALGIILYELIVGETPFEATSANAVLELVKTREVPPLREKVPDAPAELEDLIAKCTRRDRLARLGNAGAVLALMEGIRKKIAPQPVGRRETLPEMPAASESPPSGSPGSLPIVTLPSPETHKPESPREDSKAIGKIAVKKVGVTSSPALAISSKFTLSSPSEPPPCADNELDLLSAPKSKSRSTADLKSDPRWEPIEPPDRKVQPASSAAKDQPFAATLRSTPTPFGELDLEEAARAIATQAPKEVAQATKAKAPPVTPSDTAPSTRERPISSLPPVLDPRGVTEARALDIPPPPRGPTLPKEEASDLDAPKSTPKPASPPVAATPSSHDLRPRPPAAIAQASSFSVRMDRKWTGGAAVGLALTVLLSAAIPIAVVMALSTVAQPIARALRGDTTVTAGALAVVALLQAAALLARSFLGRRNGYIFGATAGALLFAIVMIIVTASASEAAELGVPSTAAGLAVLVAPITPIILAVFMLLRARGSWLDPYSRAESVRAGVFAGLLLAVAIVVSPVGAVRSASPPPVRTG